MKLLIVLDQSMARCYVATNERLLREALKGYASSVVPWRMATIKDGNWVWADSSLEAWRHISAVPYPLRAEVLI